jgi:hypothetical protein
VVDIRNLALPYFGLIFIGFACGKAKGLPESGLAWMNFLCLKGANYRHAGPPNLAAVFSQLRSVCSCLELREHHLRNFGAMCWTTKVMTLQFYASLCA